MGFSINASQNISKQTSINHVFQESSNTCDASCKAVTENVNISITNSTVGNIDFTTQCQAEALCTLRNTLAQIATQKLKSEQVATAKSVGTCWGIACVNASTNVSQQTLENSTTQIITNTCNASSVSLTEDVNIFLSGDKVGDISFTTGSVNPTVANCSVSNTASATVNQSATSSQSATSESVGFGVFLIIAVVFVIIVGGVISLARGKNSNDNSQLARILAAKAKAEKSTEGGKSVEMKTFAKTEAAPKPKLKGPKSEHKSTRRGEK